MEVHVRRGIIKWNKTPMLRGELKLLYSQRKMPDNLAGIFAASTSAVTTLLSYCMAVSKLPAHTGVARLRSHSALSAVVYLS